MSIRIDRIAHLHGPGQVRIRLLDGLIAERELLSVSSWTLERRDAVTGWTACSDGERLLTISVLYDAQQPTLLARVTHLSGVYRLTCLHESVDSGYKSCMVRCDPSGLEPLYLRMEGLNLHGDTVIHACYLDSSTAPGGFSWSVDKAAGLATSGGWSIRLVDLDGDLTAAFAPGLASRPVARLAQALELDGQQVEVDDGSQLATSGIIYVGREAITYASKSGSTLAGLVRGALDTQAQSHPIKARCFTANPYLAGRIVRIYEPRGVQGLSDSDAMIGCGVVERVQPDPENLSCYRLELSDLLGHLGTPIGRRLGHASLADTLIIDGEQTVYGRRGNDSLCFRYRSHPALPYETVTVYVVPGEYLIDTATVTDDRHICRAIENALRQAAPGLHARVSLDEESRMRIGVTVGDSFQLLAGEQPLIDRDSILDVLGFDADDLEVLINPQSSLSTQDTGAIRLELVARHALTGGVGAHNRKVFLKSDLLDNGDLARFEGGRLARVDDELMYYESLMLTSPRDAPSATLVAAVGSSDRILQADDASDFPEDGGYVLIDSELIRYARRETPGLLYGCVRGVWGSTASAHSPGATLRLATMPYLDGCVRGVYGTRASAHDGAAMIDEVICSDRISQPRAGKLEFTSVRATDFLLDLLDGTRTDSRSPIVFGPLLDANAITAVGDELPLNADGSFMRLVFCDEQVADVVADICRSLGVTLGVQANGKVALVTGQPLLAHQSERRTLSHADLTAAPVIAWREDLRINRVETSLDYNPVTEDCATRVIVDDDSGGESMSGLDHSLVVESKCLQSGRLKGVALGGDGWLYDLALRHIRQYNRFMTTLSLRTTLEAAENLGPLDSVLVDSAALPGGDGTRGIAGRHYQLTELERDYAQNEARLTLLEFGGDRRAGLAPAWLVESWDAQALELTLLDNGWWPDDMPLEQVLNDSSTLVVTRQASLDIGVYDQSDALEIANDGIDATDWYSDGRLVVVLVTAPAFSPVAGDLVTGALWDAQPAASPLRHFIHLADEDGTLGQADDPAFLYS